MLLQFRFYNFRSFKGDAVLDMRASGSNEYEYHVRMDGADKVLPVAAVYGANASGKSNVYKAFFKMCQYIATSFVLDDRSVQDANNGVIRRFLSYYPYDPFLFPQDRKTEMEVCFTAVAAGRVQYFKYGFALDEDGVREEWLGQNFKTRIVKGQPFHMLFERKRGGELSLDKDLEKYRENLELSLQKRVLILSLGAKLNIQELLPVYEWFYTQGFVSDHEDPDDTDESRLGRSIRKDTKFTKELLSFIHSFDDSIVDLEARKDLAASSMGLDAYRIFTAHRNFDGAVKWMPLTEESSGTIQMFFLFQRLQDCLARGNVLFADELDGKLHPLLMRNMILNFTDPERNPHHAQLIFTTHNTEYLDMNLLRRDEIWFTEKKDGVSDLFSLDDVQDAAGHKIRKDCNYAKNYLLGKYGAIPAMRELMGENHHE